MGVVLSLLVSGALACQSDVPPAAQPELQELRAAGVERGMALASEARFEAPGDADASLIRDFITARFAAITAAVNDGEIAQAELALNRSSDESVQALAALIIADHRVANARQAAILERLGLEPVANPASLALTAQARLTYNLLAATPRSAFDLAYLDAQIFMHAQVLAMLETTLMPLTQEPAFYDYLQDLSDSVALHLEEATRLKLALLR